MSWPNGHQKRGEPERFRCLKCQQTMTSWDEFPEYLHAGCGGTVEIKPAAHDDGIERDDRVHPCQKGTWCVLEFEHSGSCMEVPRNAHPRPAWDKKTPDPKGWREIQHPPVKLKKP